MHIKISSFHINMYVIYIVNYILTGNLIDCVMVRVLSSSAVDCGLESPSGQNKVFKIGICCFSAKYALIRRKSKDWLAWNQDNMSE
jgi:hypothetical protein